jgi:hypothetical protein
MMGGATLSLTFIYAPSASSCLLCYCVSAVPPNDVGVSGSSTLLHASKVGVVCVWRKKTLSYARACRVHPTNKPDDARAPVRNCPIPRMSWGSHECARCFGQ